MRSTSASAPAGPWARRRPVGRSAGRCSSRRYRDTIYIYIYIYIERERERYGIISSFVSYNYISRTEPNHIEIPHPQKSDMIEILNYLQ